MSCTSGSTCDRCIQLRRSEDAFKSAQIVASLKALRAQLKRKLLIDWDGSAQHRRTVRAYLASIHGAMQMALLRACSPDLNPIEYLWAWLKRYALASFCLHSLGELKSTARNELRSTQGLQAIIRPAGNKLN